MRLRPRSIEGYIRGPKIEFQYSINPKGIVHISYNPNITIADAIKYLLKMEKEIMNRVAAGHPTFPVKRSKGMFYLQRSGNPTFTQAATNAIDQNILSERFVNTLMNWNFRIIQGR
jgi:hypothetical protein